MYFSNEVDKVTRYAKMIYFPFLWNKEHCKFASSPLLVRSILNDDGNAADTEVVQLLMM